MEFPKMRIGVPSLPLPSSPRWSPPLFYPPRNPFFFLPCLYLPSSPHLVPPCSSYLVSTSPLLTFSCHLPPPLLQSLHGTPLLQSFHAPPPLPSLLPSFQHFTLFPPYILYSVQCTYTVAITRHKTNLPSAYEYTFTIVHSNILSNCSFMSKFNSIREATSTTFLLV